MSKKEILIIECISSAYMYLEEIVDRGYKVLLVNPNCKEQHVMEEKWENIRNFEKNHGKDTFEYMFCDNDADVICEAIKDHKDNILCAIAGSEYGVKVTDQVVKKLGLIGNNPDTTYKRCTKKGMIESLNEAGLRAIKTVKVTSESDIINFFSDNTIDKGFMKFSESAAGFANKTCNTVEEALDYYNVIKNIPNYFGKEQDDILLQEFIEGTEYVVNTVSCNGKHMLTDVWQYDKIINEDGDVLYNYSKLIEKLDDKLINLVNYAFKVLDAVDYKYGPCHGEYKIDKHGPVLIETNCRPMGDSTTRDFMLDISGNCIVDWSLDAYTEPDKFLDRYNKHEIYNTLQSATKKYVILNKDVYGDMAPGFTIAQHLKTFHNHNAYGPKGLAKYEKTKDLGNTPMILKLAGNNPEDVKYDIELMHKIEKDYINLLISENVNFPKLNTVDIKDIVDALNDKQNKGFDSVEGSPKTLVITEDDAYEVYNDNYFPVACDTPKIFDQVFYANTSQSTLAEKIAEILDAFKYLRPGGKAYCNQEIIDNLPYGKDGFEILKKVARV